MRTTVRLDPEVAAAAEQRASHRARRGCELARAGLARGTGTTPFRQRTASVGVKLDVTNIAEALDLLDQYEAEGAR